MAPRRGLGNIWYRPIALLVLAAGLVLAAQPGAARTILPGGDPTRIIEIEGADFVISIAADGNGRFDQRYRNATDAIIDKLSFRFSPALPASPKAESGVFGAVFANRDLVVFDLGQTGSGIPLGAVFRIRMGGLVPFTASAFGANDPGPIVPPGPVVPPGAVPLPPAGLLLAAALGSALLVRRRTA